MMAPPRGSADDLRVTIAAAAQRLAPLAGRFTVHDVVGSTNDEAARLAALDAPEGTTVVADAQSDGRGRGGRSWFSPPGAGLYLSVVLRPAHPGGSAAPVPWVRLITLAAGVAVAEGIRAATALPVELKWPNDVIVSDARGARAAERRWRKAAGILAEASAVGSAVQHVILGVGINVRAAAYPQEIAGRATSLEAELGRAVDRGAVLVETLAALRTRYDDLRQGRGREVLARWRELSPTAEGAWVSVPCEGAVREGITAGLAEDGSLNVRTAEGTESLVSGDLTWL
jgi:BirA family biotin operon repressor/biotin-[acetyl-CoA-carboxylase] ligase